MAKRRDILDPKNISRLASIGFKKMEAFRRQRMMLLAQHTGRMYAMDSPVGERRAFPMNLIHQAVTTMVPNLVYKNPNAKIDSVFLAYKEYAMVAELALEHLFSEIGLRKTLRKIITDAIFLAGFRKSGIATSGNMLEIDGILHDIGQPYCDRVDPDDMLLDPVARQWEEQRFIGNRFRADVEVLKDIGGFDADTIEGLHSRHEQSASAKEVSHLSGFNEIREADQVIKTIDLVEIWIPDDNVVLTMPWGPGGEVEAEILRETEYEGPEEGPYDMLCFSPVPDNILGVAPAMIWYDLHMMANKIVRKAVRQAERDKSILAYQSNAWNDAQSIVEGLDGEAIRVEDIDAIKEVHYGGATDDAYRFIDWAKGLFSEMAMNMDMLSGAGSDEATATQAELVQQNSSIRLSDMQSIVYHFTEGVAKSLFFYLHTDPLIDLPMVKRTAGVDHQVEYTPEMREGDWIDYNIKLRPYSMSRQDPNVKIRRLMELFGSVLPAIANAQQMMGPAFNSENAINIIGREMDIEELDEIINSQALAASMQNMQAMLEAGVPVDVKAASMAMNPSNITPNDTQAPGTANPQQPNPMGNIQQGVTPQTETNMRQQETAGELQGALL